MTNINSEITQTQVYISLQMTDVKSLSLWAQTFHLCQSEELAQQRREIVVFAFMGTLYHVLARQQQQRYRGTCSNTKTCNSNLNPVRKLQLWCGWDFQILEESFKYGKVGDKVIEWDKDQRGDLSLIGWKSKKFKRQMITFWFLSQFVCFRTFLVGFRKCTFGNFQFYGDWIKCHFMAKYRKS